MSPVTCKLSKCTDKPCSRLLKPQLNCQKIKVTIHTKHPINPEVLHAATYGYLFDEIRSILDFKERDFVLKVVLNVKLCC